MTFSRRLECPLRSQSWKTLWKIDSVFVISAWNKMGLFYKHSFHIYIPQKIKYRRHHHSFLLLHSNKIYLQLYTHISHYNWNKVLWTMSSPSSGLLTLVSLDDSFCSFSLSCIFACLLIQRFVSVCMFQRVISQNMFYNWTMFIYTQNSRDTNTQFNFGTFMFQGIFLLLLFTLTGMCFFLYEGNKLSWKPWSLVFDASEIGLNAFYALIVLFYSSHRDLETSPNNLVHHCLSSHLY